MEKKGDLSAFECGILFLC